jgi:tetratricopeptide (TPR) repeat protein
MPFADMPDSDQKPASEPPTPSGPASAVGTALLLAGDEYPFTEFAKQLEGSSFGGQTPTEVELKNATLFFQMAGQLVALAFMPAPYPWSDLEGWCATSWSWPDHTPALSLKQHRTHLLITMIGGNSDPIGRRLMLTQLTALAAQQEGVVGVCWPEATLVLYPPVFVSLAKTHTLPKLPPIVLWVDFRVFRNADESSSLFTTGLKDLTGLELEIPNIHVEMSQLRNAALNIVYFLLRAGERLKDGDKMGAIEQQELRLRHLPSLFGHPGTVLRLEVLGEAGASTPSAGGEAAPPQPATPPPPGPQEPFHQAAPGPSGDSQDTAEEPAARLRHASHYCEVADKASRLYQQGGANRQRALELFDREWPQIESAFAFLAGVLTPVLPRAPGAVLPPAEHGAAEEDRTERANLLIFLVNAVRHISDARFEPAQYIRWLQAQRQAARLVHNRTAEGWALGNLGLAHFGLGDAPKAIGWFEQCLALHRETGERGEEARDLGNLGRAHQQLGDLGKAIACYEQELRIVREIGDWLEEGSALGRLGVAHRAAGDAGKGIEFHQQSLSVFRDIGNGRGEGCALADLGNAHAEMGEMRQAIEFYQQALEVMRRIGDRQAEGEIFGKLGAAYEDLDEPRQAQECCDQALAIARETGDRRTEANALWNSALALYALDDLPEALARGEAALGIFDALEDLFAADARALLAEWRANG